MAEEFPQVETDLWLRFGLLFVGGYGEAAGFILTHTFTGHPTGTLVLFGISTASHDFTYAVRELIALGIFPMGVVLSILLARGFGPSAHKRILPFILSVEIVLFALASLALRSPIGREVAIRIVVFCFALALGLQTGAFRHVRWSTIHTTDVTRMLTTFIASLARRNENAVAGENSKQCEPSRGFRGWVWAAFLAGGLIGAKLILNYRGLGILGEILVLTALAVRTRPQHEDTVKLPVHVTEKC